MSIFLQAIESIQTPSIEQDMLFKPSKGQCRGEICIVLIKELNES